MTLNHFTLHSAIIIALLSGGFVLYRQFAGIQWLDLIQNQVPFQIVIGVAACAAVSAIYGYFTICCKSRLFRMIYALLVIFVIVFEVVMIFLIVKYDDTILTMLQDTWAESGENNDLKQLRKAIEKAFQCCGFDNETSPERLEESYDCGYEYKPDPTIMIEFCTETLYTSISENTKNLEIVGIVLVVLELVLLICAIYQVHTARKSKDHSEISA